MGRKILHFTPKNFYRKRGQQPSKLTVSLHLRVYSSLIISIPVELIKPISLPISYSLDMYLQAPLTDISVLHERLVKSTCLPSTWNLDHTVLNQSQLFLYRINSAKTKPCVSHIITVSASLQCTVSKYGNDVSWTKHICSVSSLSSFIESFNKAILCIGNSDSLKEMKHLKTNQVHCTCKL
jgi:hypothetical protein